MKIALLGGGHAHALLARHWGKQPIPGTSMTLVSRDRYTPYSGMLPGYVAGHYTRDQAHIDLKKLCAWAGVEFIEATATALDVSQQFIKTDCTENVEYRVLSLDTGSIPDTQSVPGASDFSIPVKPVHLFEEKWLALLERTSDKPTSIGLVGAGAGGLELLLAVDHTMRERGLSVALHWFVRTRPLKNQPRKVSEWVLNVCAERDITVHHDFSVSQVSEGKVIAEDGRQVELDEILWVTAARAPEWPAESGLATDDRGFVKVHSTLQSMSHDNVFAAGDIASMPSPGVAKAGVYAVRQAPVLFENLERFSQGQTLKAYVPQKNFLTLISLGNKAAVGSRNGFALKSRWAWTLKDRIDRKFMGLFSEL